MEQLTAAGLTPADSKDVTLEFNNQQLTGRFIAYTE